MILACKRLITTHRLTSKGRHGSVEIGIGRKILSYGIMYDDDLSQIGRNTFTDPIYAPYTSLLELAKVMVSNENGEGFYSFTSSDDSIEHRKEVVWTTVTKHGTAWRVAAIRSAD